MPPAGFEAGAFGGDEAGFAVGWDTGFGVD
jgi:hypothetical protein